MCRAAPHRRQLAKVPACAPRHIGAHWITTLPRSPPALAPGTAPLALRNARLPKDDPRYTTLPRPRVCWPRSSHAAQWPRLPQAPGAATEPLRGPQPPQLPVNEPLCYAGHCFARAQQCPAFRLFWSAGGVGKVSASRASVRALGRCHRRHASLRLVLAASPARWRRRPL